MKINHKIKIFRFRGPARFDQLFNDKNPGASASRQVRRRYERRDSFAMISWKFDLPRGERRSIASDAIRNAKKAATQAEL